MKELELDHEKLVDIERRLENINDVTSEIAEKITSDVSAGKPIPPEYDVPLTEQMDAIYECLGELSKEMDVFREAGILPKKGRD